MEFTLADQTIYFLYSLLFGVLLSVLYDVVRIIRFCGFTRTWQIITSDILYFVLCAFLTAIFAMPFNKGGIRAFVLFGESIGFLLYRFTIGEYLAAVYCFFIRIFKKILKKFSKFTAFFSNKLLKANTYVVYNVGDKIYKLQNVVYKKHKRNINEQKKGTKTKKTKRK